MIGLKEGSFLGYAVADLGKGVTTVYRGGHISFRVDAARGGIITPRGDALVYDEKGAHLVPGGDFTGPSLFVTPSRYVPERPSFARSMGFVSDPSGSLVWIQQDISNVPGHWSEDRGGTRSRNYRNRETWVDLFNIDTGEIVLMADILGDWGVAGALEERTADARIA